MMKRKFWLLMLLPALLLLGLARCNKDEKKGDGTLKLDFEFIYGDGPFVINEVYDYPLGYDLKFERLMLYVSNVKFIAADGSVESGPEIIFVKASADDNAVAFTLPEGNYEKMEFSIGVPAKLNGTDNPDFDAALYDNAHPLSLNNGMYWTWNTGYRFILMDGRVNTNPDEDGDFETLLSIHTGKDYSFRTKLVNRSFILNKDGLVNLKMRFNVEGFLNNTDDMIDIKYDNQSHGTNEGLANRVSNNAIKSTDILP